MALKRQTIKPNRNKIESYETDSVVHFKRNTGEKIGPKDL